MDTRVQQHAGAVDGEAEREEDEKNDINVLGFYQDLLDYSKKCTGTVFTEDAIEYIRAKIYEYGEKVRLKE